MLKVIKVENVADDRYMRELEREQSYSWTVVNISALNKSGGVPKGGMFLDYGCNSGKMCKSIAGEGSTCVGVDNNTTAILRARAWVRQDACKYYTPTQFWKNPATTRRFDRILLSFTLGHLTNPAEILKALGELLHPNGRIVIIESNITQPWRWFTSYKYKHKQIQSWSVKNIEKLAHNCDLRVKSISYAGKKTRGLKWFPENSREYMCVVLNNPKIDYKVINVATKK